MIIYTVYIQNSIYNNHTSRSCLFIYYLYESIIITTIMHIMCLLSFTAPSPLLSLPNPPSSIFGRSRCHTSSRIPSPTLCCACRVSLVPVLFLVSLWCWRGFLNCFFFFWRSCGQLNWGWIEMDILRLINMIDGHFRLSLF